jgi:hypothetical protein
LIYFQHLKYNKIEKDRILACILCFEFHVSYQEREIQPFDDNPNTKHQTPNTKHQTLKAKHQTDGVATQT